MANFFYFPGVLLVYYDILSQSMVVRAGALESLSVCLSKDCIDATSGGRGLGPESQSWGLDTPCRLKCPVTSFAGCELYVLRG